MSATTRRLGLWGLLLALLAGCGGSAPPGTHSEPLPSQRTPVKRGPAK